MGVTTAKLQPLIHRRLFRLRMKSLARGNLLVGISLLLSFALSRFPHIRPTLWLIIPCLLSIWGTAETVRCMQPRWSWFHGGVLMCIYTDLMALTLNLFFLIYPYW
jgi:hypothetical protein